MVGRAKVLQLNVTALALYQNTSSEISNSKHFKNLYKTTSWINIHDILLQLSHQCKHTFIAFSTLPIGLI